MISFESHHSNVVDYLYRQYDENIKFSTHFHDSYEFIYVYDGELTISVDKNKYTVKKGEGALILPNQVHSYDTLDYSKTFILIFASSYVAKFYKPSLIYAADNPIIKLEENDFLLETLTKASDKYLLKSQLYLLVYLYRLKEQVPRDEKYTNLLQNILTYVEAHYNEDISLTTLADYLGYEHHYLSSIINTGLNKNFLSFINEYRIRKVCELMIDDSSTTISELAYSCGYTSLRTFNRNFVSIMGETPKEYRQKLIEHK